MEKESENICILQISDVVFSITIPPPPRPRRTEQNISSYNQPDAWLHFQYAEFTCAKY